MKKKHLLTAVCLSACIFGAQAQWTDTYQPRTVDKTNKDIATIDAAGNVIVAGTFTKDFTFGDTKLEPLASSTYAVKYSASGAKLGAVSIKGAATITALTTDPTGNIYVAGNFADAVIFGSTDGNTQTKTGILGKDSQPITALGACFLAKYSPAGVLLKVETYLPSPLINLNPEMMYDGYYNLKSIITQLKYADDKLYASIITTGILENNGITLKGSYYDIFGLMYENIQSAALISINNDLQFSKLYATLCPPDGEAFQYNVQYPQFANSATALYFSAIATGKQKLNINGSKDDIELFSNGGNFSQGYIIAGINAGTGDKIAFKVFEADAEDYYKQPKRTIGAMFLHNNNLLLTGTSNKKLAFNKSEETADPGIFVAALNTGDLSQVIYAVQNTISGDEDYSSATIYNDKLNIAYNDITAKSSGIFSVSLADGTGSAVSEATANTYTNSLFAANGKLVTVKATTSAVGTDPSTVSVSTADVTTPTGIRNPKAAAVSFYPNPVTSVIYLSAPGNIDVYNSLGILVKQAVAVDQLSVENLPAGIYFATVKTAGNTTNIKFIKK
jgi:hypothetical protein